MICTRMVKTIRRTRSRERKMSDVKGEKAAGAVAAAAAAAEKKTR